jgi:hypothetical protein
MSSPQALDWITDLYDHEREIVANGQTIVYSLHQSIGHLGIFVSGKVASKEHAKFASCIGMIELAPPGLYEAVIRDAGPDDANAELIDGRYLFRLEPRTLGDIRALGGNTPEDDRCFATAARVSEINKALYSTLVAPAVRALANPGAAEAMRQFHPNRLRFAAFSDRNPFMAMVGPLAEQVRADRRPADPENPLLALEHVWSSLIETGLENFGSLRDSIEEATFFAIYGSPVLQALMGFGPEEAAAARPAERDLVREADQAQLRIELDDGFEAGTPLDACVRALVYIRLPEGGADERAFNLLRKLRAAEPADARRSSTTLKEVLKDQFLLVSLDAERAIQALPQLLPREKDKRLKLWKLLQEIIAAPGPLSAEGQRRASYVETLFDVKAAEKQESEHG